MKMRDRAAKRRDIRANLALISVILAFLIVGIVSHAIYFVSVFGITLVVILYVFSLLFRILVGESLFKIIAFRIRRDLRKY